jgi:hypothetical protein
MVGSIPQVEMKVLCCQHLFECFEQNMLQRAVRESLAIIAIIFLFVKLTIRRDMARLENIVNRPDIMLGVERNWGGLGNSVTLLQPLATWLDLMNRLLYVSRNYV